MLRPLSLIFSCTVLASIAASASAGPLATHPDGIPAFTGSTPFDSGGGLSGYVDYAVFLPGDYPAGYLGYTPPVGHLAYTYQVYVDPGSFTVSAFAVGIDGGNPVGTIGFFSGNDGNGLVAGDPPIASTFSGFPIDTAEWDFAGILASGQSAGLVYSSPNIPMDYFGSVIDTGESAFVIPLPSPSPVPVPEPATFALAGLSVVALVACGARRRRTH